MELARADWPHGPRDPSWGLKARRAVLECPPGNGVMRGSGHRADPHRRLSQSEKMVVFPPLVHIHLPRRPPHRASMAGLRLHVLPQGAGVLAQRPQTEGAEGRARQAGVRGHLHDRGQRLGRRTHLRTDHHGTDSGTLSIFNSTSPLLPSVSNRRRVASTADRYLARERARRCLRDDGSIPPKRKSSP